MVRFSKILALALVAIIVGTAAVGCGQKGKPEEPAKPSAQGEAPAAGDGGDKIVIAGACPMTGDGAQYGEFLSRSLILAAEMINEKGGVNGKKIEIRMEDDQQSPREAATIAEKIGLDKSVVAVVGHTTSTCTLAAVPIYERHSIPVVSHSATSPKLSGSSKFFFRTCSTDEFFGYAGGEYVVKRLGKTKVAILHALSDGPTAYAKAFEKAVKDSGGQVLAVMAHEENAKDFSAEMTKVKALKPDAILLSTWYTPAAMIVKQAKEAGIEGVQFVGNDAVYAPDFIKVGGADVEGTIIAGFFHPDLPYPMAKEYVQRFRAKYNEDPEWSGATAFDALNIIVEAIKKNGATREGILEYLSGIGTKYPEFEGVTGKTKFDDKGDVVKPAVFVVVRDGQFKLAPVQ